MKISLAFTLNPMLNVPSENCLSENTLNVLHVASTTPYGYLKDKDDPNVWIVDEEAAVVVRRIFHMTMDGYGPYQIARALKEDKVELSLIHI